eukprot:TRINITY_DN4086_c0_g3_i1.p1 TRINITY_DN4086_c0_g3~~TRINITY_DN4086_c0_g3_i1.p1  ORF type:complete len:268 (+),score=76.80 TRINITY_DN4086_c0_g3_i1:468-1271(+)
MPKEREGDWLSEIKVLQQIDHPSIIKVYEFASDDNYYYLVSEYSSLTPRFIEGGELFDEIIKRKYMCEEDAAYIIRQLLWAITYCHSRGIVHRDLKPENTLIDSVTESGKLNVKIIDFGAALLMRPEAKLSETLGTPYYIAPEVLNGSYNEKCDVWSIGVILFILLSGCAPFNGKTDEEIMNNVRKGEYSFKSNLHPTLGRIWAHISDSAKDLIKKMLAYNPESRISAMNAFKHEWLESKQFNALTPGDAQEIISNMSELHVRRVLR